MKRLFSFSVKAVTVLLLCLLLLPACNKNNSAGNSLDKDTSYAFGMFMASFMKAQMGLPDLHYDYDAFREGFMAFNEARETRLTEEQMMEKIMAALNVIEQSQNEEMWLEGEKNREAGEAYMADNGRRSEVTTTPSGLQYEVIVQGTGEKPSGPSDVVRVHYEGTLLDGTVFDSSYQRGEPIEFPLNQVIAGWTEGVQLMNTGSTFIFVIPSDLAYGPGANGPIPPSSTLIFRVELLGIVR